MGSWSSYNEENAKYKYNKAIPLDDLPIMGKTKKKKQHKKSNHKHKYIPAIYHRVHINAITNEKELYDCYGFHCKYCGRLENMWYIWSHNPEKIEEFKEKYPNYVEVTLPDTWCWFKNNYIPIS